MLEKPVRSVSTQTDPPKKCPQTKQNNKQMMHNKPKIFYPCIIGSCERRLQYSNLIYHLKTEHSSTFTEANLNVGEPFLKKFHLSQQYLPCIHDFSFFIMPMGLFFLNVTIHATGELIARILYLNGTMHKVFSCEFGLSCRNVMLKDHGIIKSCDPLREMLSNYQFRIDKDKMFRIKRTMMLECTLKIAEIRQNQPNNNNVIP